MIWYLDPLPAPDVDDSSLFDAVLVNFNMTSSCLNRKTWIEKLRRGEAAIVALHSYKGKCSTGCCNNVTRDEIP